MVSKGGGGRIVIVPFTDKWLEGYLDLAVHSDLKDPLEGPISREDVRSRMELHKFMGITKAHFVAVEKSRAVGSAKVNLVQTCSPEKKAYFSLLVEPNHRRQGVGTRLLNRTCKEIASQGIEWIEMGILDSWEGWRRFFKKNGFKAHGIRTADIILRTNVPIPGRLPRSQAAIRPIRLPEERNKWIEFSIKELSQDLPGACATPSGGPTPWEVEPEASRFDPKGFLVASDRNTKDMVGYVYADFGGGQERRGVIAGIDIAQPLPGTRLKERLLIQAVKWLRGKGAVSVEGRLHVGYRDDEEVFRKVGFELRNSATVWRRKTSRVSR